MSEGLLALELMDGFSWRYDNTKPLHFFFPGGKFGPGTLFRWWKFLADEQRDLSIGNFRMLIT